MAEDKRYTNENGNKVPVDPKVWNKHAGQWADKEKARAAGRLGGLKAAETKRKNKALAEALADKGKFITEALATAMDDKPDFLVEMIDFLHKSMNDPALDIADRMKAFDRLQSLTGLQPPRQVEKQKETKTMSYEDIVRSLEAEGVEVDGKLNVVEKK